jgi:pimeloyl-ACP methyl ester carboxylesterase
MFEGFQSSTITTQSDPKVDIYGLSSGDSTSQKPPLLLLHGFPQTLHIWHLVAPQLTQDYTVVLCDLRGYGKSSKPEDVAQYAKSLMARDCIAVMDQLGFKDKFYVCAHDRGARVAHKLLVDYPERVHRAVLLDICPTLAMYESTNQAFATAYFHWFFLIQKEPMPEMVLLANPTDFARVFMGGRQKAGVEIFHQDCFDAYIQNLSDPATVHAMCNDYRASATLDMEESRSDLKDGKLIKTPLRVLWGQHGVIEMCFDALKEWRAVSQDAALVDGHAANTGHYIPEEASEEVVKEIKGFFV